MRCKEAYGWAEKSDKRKSILLNLKQPMTALQLKKKTGFNQDQCSAILGQLTLCGLVKCLNPTATRSRLYWLTPTELKELIDKQIISVAHKLLVSYK